MAFDPKPYMIRLQGNKEYLPVAARLIWFREEHPFWSISTTMNTLDLEKQLAIFHATISDDKGNIIAQGTKAESAKGFGEYIEKAETGAVGRALAMAGFGTQHCGGDFDEGGRLADAPQSARGSNQRPPQAPLGIPKFFRDEAQKQNLQCNDDQLVAWAAYSAKLPQDEQWTVELWHRAAKNLGTALDAAAAEDAAKASE